MTEFNGELKNNLFKYLSFFFLFGELVAFGQTDPCVCNLSGKTTVCYLSAKEYCYNVPGCQHALDGQFMQEYLTLKLTNKENFGSFGKSDCGIELHELLNLKTVRDIEDAHCDIIFTGSFAVDTLQYKINSDITSVPLRVLDTIKFWSTKCDRNLVIVSQAEAKPWGYTIKNQNVNPNKAIAEPSRFSIFSGVFGNLTQFQQGGSYQGVIVKTPETGVEILAQDAKKKPTVAFDIATKDIILGDIGILCGIAGFISEGGEILKGNDNDILAGNLFALGCLLGKGTKFSEESQYFCPGSVVVLPNGRKSSEETLYVDSLKTRDGCDSLHYIKYFKVKPALVPIKKNLCKGQAFSLKVGDVIFDENNPKGTIILKDKYSCDSTILVDLIYNHHSTAYIRDTVCAGSGFSMAIGKDLYDEKNNSGISVLQNKAGCDSTVVVNINFTRPDSTTYILQRCVGDTVSFAGQKLPPGKTYYFNYKVKNLCDSIIVLQIDTFLKPYFLVDTVIETQQYFNYQFSNIIPPGLKIHWEEYPILSCIDCPNPDFKATEFPPVFHLTITDANACSYKVNIRVEYNCEFTLPNVFMPGSDNKNENFNWANSCPVYDFNIKIFDRWGNEVFASSDVSGIWDGTSKGRLLNEGVYVYLLSFTSNDKPKHQHGSVTLIRKK